ARPLEALRDIPPDRRVGLARNLPELPDDLLEVRVRFRGLGHENGPRSNAKRPERFKRLGAPKRRQQRTIGALPSHRRFVGNGTPAPPEARAEAKILISGRPE